jgi:hypothetical protein
MHNTYKALRVKQFLKEKKYSDLSGNGKIHQREK